VREAAIARVRKAAKGADRGSRRLDIDAVNSPRCHYGRWCVGATIAAEKRRWCLVGPCSGCAA